MPRDLWNTGQVYRVVLVIKIYRNNLDRDKFNPLLHKPKSFKIDGFSPNQTFEIEFFGKNIEKIKNIFCTLYDFRGILVKRSRKRFGELFPK